MNYRPTEGLSLCSAVALGVAISTGYPAGIVAAVGMPIACLTPASRKLAFRNTISYYLAGLWPMVSGAGHFTGNVPIAILFWAGTATLLSAPWALAWTPKRGLHCLWRVILAGIAGYLFPGTGWAGMAATALLPGITLALPDSRSRICVRLALPAVVAMAVGSHSLAPPEPRPPANWTAVSTHFDAFLDAGRTGFGGDGNVFVLRHTVRVGISEQTR